MTTKNSTRATKLAELEWECRRCNGRGEWGDDLGSMVGCEVCSGSGTVPVFQGVRDPCMTSGDIDPDETADQAISQAIKHLTNPPPVCENCSGRGWTATLDSDRWAAASEGFWTSVAEALPNIPYP